MYIDGKMLFGLIVWLIIGLLLIISGIRARMSYRRNFSGHVRGVVVSSRCEKRYETHDDKPYYDMYATVNYEVNGELYQAHFSFLHSKKYYHFISDGSFIDICYDPNDPNQAQISRLFANKGGTRIAFGLIFDLLIIFVIWYNFFVV